jgi:hypothetical protein
MRPLTSADPDVATPVASGGFVSGLFRVFEAGERLLVEQAELLRLDSREKLSSFAARFGIGALGALCVFTAWLGFLAAAVVTFDLLPLGTRLALAALAQLALGVGLILAARRRSKGGGDGDDGDA